MSGVAFLLLCSCVVLCCASESADSSLRFQRLYSWLAEHGGRVNTDRVEVRLTEYGGHGVFVKACPQCALNGTIYPAWRSLPHFPEKSETCASGDSTCASSQADDLLHDPVYGVDPMLAVVPLTSAFYFFSPRLAPSTQEVISAMLSYESEVIASGGEIAGFDHDGKEIRDGSFADRLNVVSLALELRNATSFFRPYFETVAYDSSVRTSVRFSAEEREVLAKLNQTFLVRQAEFMEYFFATIIPSDERRSHPAFAPFANISPPLRPEELATAYDLFRQRAYSVVVDAFADTVPEPLPRRSEHDFQDIEVLLPFLDLLNHHNDLEPEDNRYYTSPHSSPRFEMFAVGLHFTLRGLATPVSGGEGVVADERLAFGVLPGSELFHTYGTRTNAHLFMYYYFVWPTRYDYASDFAPPACCIYRSHLNSLYEELRLQTALFEDLEMHGSEFVHRLHEYAEAFEILDDAATAEVLSHNPVLRAYLDDAGNIARALLNIVSYDQLAEHCGETFDASISLWGFEDCEEIDFSGESGEVFVDSNE